MRSLIPSSQVLEQDVHCPHIPQWPLIGSMEANIAKLLNESMLAARKVWVVRTLICYDDSVCSYDFLEMFRIPIVNDIG